jgi:hypothetical protein
LGSGVGQSPRGNRCRDRSSKRIFSGEKVTFNAKEYNRQWKKEHPDKVRAARALWEAANLEKKRAYSREANRRWRERNPKHAAEYYQKNKERLVAHQARYREENRAGIRVKLMQHYHDRRARILAGRTNCDICGCAVAKPRIDHNHEIAKRICGHLSNSSHCERCRRGVLCNNCNTAIGKLHENIKVLDKAKRYLRYWTKKLGGVR